MLFSTGSTKLFDKTMLPKRKHKNNITPHIGCDNRVALNATKQTDMRLRGSQKRQTETYHPKSTRIWCSTSQPRTKCEKILQCTVALRHLFSFSCSRLNVERSRPSPSCFFF